MHTCLLTNALNFDDNILMCTNKHWMHLHPASLHTPCACYRRPHLWRMQWHSMHCSKALMSLNICLLSQAPFFYDCRIYFYGISPRNAHWYSGSLQRHWICHGLFHATVWILFNSKVDKSASQPKLKPKVEEMASKNKLMLEADRAASPAKLNQKPTGRPFQPSLSIVDISDVSNLVHKLILIWKLVKLIQSIKVK